MTIGSGNIWVSLHIINFSVLKYSIIYSLKAQTTLAVQTVQRVNVSGEGK